MIFHLQGKVGAAPLSPDNYDVVIMRRVLDNAIALLGLDGSNDNQPTTLKISDGSVKNIFYTPIQKTAEFTAVLMMVTGSFSLELITILMLNRSQQKSGIFHNLVKKLIKNLHLAKKIRTFAKVFTI